MPTTAQEAQAKIQDIIATQMGEFLTSQLGGLPIVGGLLTGLMNKLWPQAGGTDVWDSIKTDVQNLISADLSDFVVTTTGADLSGLQNVLNDYLTAAGKDDKTTIVTNFWAAKLLFDDRIPHFQEQGYELLLLPYYAQVVNMNLTLLRDGALHGSDWGLDTGDIATITTALTGLITTAGAWVDQWYPTGMPATGYDGNVNLTLYNGQTNYTTRMTMSVLDFRNLWQWFDPAKRSAGKPMPGLTREIFSDSYWGDPTKFPAMPAGLITTVQTWGATRPLGVQLEYTGGVWATMEGKNDGITAPISVLQLLPARPMASAYFTTADGDGWNIPRFDKMVTLTNGDPQNTVALGSTLNDPIHLNDEHVDMGLTNVAYPVYEFPDHIISSVHLNYWAGVPRGGDWDPVAVANIVVGFRRYDGYASQQASWRWCKRCQGMYYVWPEGSPWPEGSANVCVAGGKHDSTGSKSYIMFAGDEIPGAQGDWGWCQKCGGIYYHDAPSVCVYDQLYHYSGDSGKYAMLLAGLSRTTTTQDGWQWCHKCGLLFFSQNPGSLCPVGGAHDPSGSAAYTVKYSDMS